MITKNVTLSYDQEGKKWNKIFNPGLALIGLSGTGTCTFLAAEPREDWEQVKLIYVTAPPSPPRKYPGHKLSRQLRRLGLYMYL